jgi:hypothetical protein
MPVGDYTNGERIERDDDPDRCQGTSREDQCRFKKLPGSNYCSMHGGNKHIVAEAKANVNRYRLTKWQAQVERFKSESDIKSLRDEIGILRVLMEERLNHCTSNVDLILHSGPISDLVVKIEKLVRSCHEIDKDFNTLLDKSHVMLIADQIISVLSEEIKDTELMERIQKRLLTVLVKKNGESDGQSSSD